LIFSGQLLTGDAKLLRDCRITDGAFVHLVPKLVTTAATRPQPHSNDGSSPQHNNQQYAFNNYTPYDFSVAVDEDGAMGGQHRNTNTTTYDGVTFVTHVWRSRVRMLASIMLFFYMLDLLGK
jgi:hypothetical protein